MTEPRRPFPTLLIAALLAAPPVSFAQTSWTGSSGNNWSLPGSWSNGVPAAGVTTVINGPSAVQLTDPAQATGQLTIGSSGTGSLAISSTGALTSSSVFLGSPASSRGTVTISGSSASWNIADTLAIGGNATTIGGTGSFSVTNGANVTIGGALRLWNGGAFTLDGGTVTTQSLNRSLGSFNFYDGTLIVSGGTLTEPTAATRFLIIQGNTSGKTPTLVLDGLQNNPNYNGGIYIADAADRSGALTLSGGTVLTAQGILVGRNSNSVGKLTLDGAGTSLTNIGSGSDIGRSGIGTLDIKNGAVFTEGGSAYIGSGAGSSGVATISGTGSLWNNAGYILRVGSSGTGVLNILNGGQVTSHEARISELSGSTGTATVDGAGSTWTNSGAIFVGANGKLDLTNGGRINTNSATISGTVKVDGLGSVWTGSNHLTIGTTTGNGTLTVQNSGTVLNTRGYLGQDTGSVGTATITGTGSKWANSEALYIGNSGRGILNVREGGAVSSVSAFLGYNTNFAISSANIDGAGSTWANTNTLFVGYAAGSTLNITNGGQVTTDHAYVAYQGAYYESTVNIDGPGSKLTVNGDLYNAYGFTGIINITNGGALVVANTLSNYNPAITLPAAGVITLDGGSITTKNFYVGASGGTFSHKDGTLTIDGGTFDYRLNDLFVIEGDGSTKTATIVFNNLDHTPTFLEIDIGYTADQRGALTISGGSKVVSNNGAFLGRAAGSHGDVTVTGSDSSLSVQQLAIGGSSSDPGGTGRLTIEDGGKVTAAAGATIWEDGILDGDEGAFSGDIINHGTISPGESPGTLTIEGNLSLTATGRIVLDIQGTTADTEYDQLIVTGLLDLNAGTLVFDFNTYIGDPLGQIFVIFPDQSFAGQTFAYSWSGLGDGYAVDTTTYASIGAITVIAIPEPGAMALLQCAGVVLIASYRRRRR
jgi:fibronectin-binding autotransporter adhesin